MSYDKVSLLLPMDGSNNGTVFTDWSLVPETVTRVGVVTSTAESKFYGSSGLFNGGTHNILCPVTIGVDAFTIEAWLYQKTNPEGSSTFFTTRPTSAGEGIWVIFRHTATGYVNRLITYSSEGVAAGFAGVTSPSLNSWHHMAVVGDGTNISVYLNGVFQVSAPKVNLPQEIIVGDERSFGTSLHNLIGHMQDLRITKDAALYTANFTPPTRLIGTISNAAVGAAKILDKDGSPAIRKVFAVPRSYLVNNTGVARIWSTTSNASGEFEIRAPAYECSVVTLADEIDVYNDLIARVIPV